MLSRAFDHICMEKARYKFLIIIIIIIIIIIVVCVFQKCLSMCMDRYMDAWNTVSKTYTTRLQKEHSQGGSF